jgi:gliding motility-associated-like protein
MLESFKMKKLITFIFICFSYFSFSQENCFNGIDDNGDGLIDLNDPLCICNNTQQSIIPNHSFENYSALPTSFSQLILATPWQQASLPTTDYYNTSGFVLPGLSALLAPFPDGTGIVGTFYENNWKEYLGSPLLNPMLAGTNYQLRFNIAAVSIQGTQASNITNLPNLGPVNVTIYGKTGNATFPLNTQNDPVSFDPTWMVLGQVSYNPVSSWGELTINFTPSVNINTIMIGPPIVLPSTYPNYNTLGVRPYMVYDNLRLNTTTSFGATISSNGNFCQNNLVLSAVPFQAGFNYQWYFNGVAIAGATNSTYNVPFAANNMGNYNVRIYQNNVCANSAAFNVNATINTPLFTQVTPICFGGTLNPLPTTSNNGISGSWSPALNNLATTTYTFTPNAGQCATTQTMEIVVSPNITPSFTPIAPICSGGTLNPLPTTSNNGILGSWSPVLNNLVSTTYTFTPNAGQCATTQTMEIVVKPRPSAPLVSIPPSYCFNQTALPLVATGSNLLWYYTLTSGTGSILAPVPDTSVVGISNYYVTQTIDGCESNRTLVQVNVTPIPIVIVPPEFSICTGESTNVQLSSNVPNALFYWSIVSGSIDGAITGIGLSSFTNTILNLQTGATTPSTIVYSVIATVNGCSGPESFFSITVNPIPTINIPVFDSPICSGNQLNINLSSPFPNTTFSWNIDLTQTNGVSGYSQGTGNSITDTLFTTGLNQGTVTYLITPRLGNCLGNPLRITIVVKPLPLVNSNNLHTPICSGGSPNFLIISANPNVAYIYTYNQVNVIGATGGNTFANPNGQVIIDNQTLVTTGTIQGYVEYFLTPILNNCNGNVITVKVPVNPIPRPTLKNGVICKDVLGNVYQNYILDAGLSNNIHTFAWTFTNNQGITSPLTGITNTQIATEEGIYTVIATHNATGCVSQQVSANVTSSLQAVSITATVSSMFSSESKISVIVTGGTGKYWYQLDEGNYQESNLFLNVNSGKHTINVIDVQGCTYLSTTVTVIDYMKFFTPNGDNYHDTWKIIGLNQENAKIYIFDRFGKLIKQLSGSENTLGWDGNYNGNPLPSSDYWFTIEYLENNEVKNFRSHFSLKR